MNSLEVLKDLAARPGQAADYYWENLDPAALNAHPGGHPNSVAWLIWHAARETDAQIAPLAEVEQVWTSQGFDRRFDLGDTDLGYEDMGLGQNDSAARSVHVPETGDGKSLLREYFDAVFRMTSEWIGTLGEADLDRVIDESWDPPVTLGVRVISAIDDAAQHVGQAAYVAGMPEVP